VDGGPRVPLGASRGIVVAARYTVINVSLSVPPELTSLVHTLVILFTEYGNHSGDRERRAGAASLLGVGFQPFSL
jgi:hypothetical protein